MTYFGGLQALQERQTALDIAKQTQIVQNRNATGRVARPAQQARLPPADTTEVTVSVSAEDRTRKLEKRLRRRHPADLVREIQRLLQ
jgi:hypothetical protein